MRPQPPKGTTAMNPIATVLSTATRPFSTAKKRAHRKTKRAEKNYDAIFIALIPTN